MVDIDALLKDHSEEDLLKSTRYWLGYDHNTDVPTIREFITSKYYLGESTREGKGIYPYWWEQLEDMFPNPYYNRYLVVCFRGAIGLGKTTAAIIAYLYIVAKLILMEDPREFFQLLSVKTIQAFLYSLKKDKVITELRNPLIIFIENSPFFREHLVNSNKLLFTNNIGILTGSRLTDNVSSDIPVALMDEVQLNIITDQLEDNYNSIKARITSRFMLSGGLYHNAMIFLCGSAGGGNSFIERFTEEARTDPTIKLLDPTQWEVLSGKINYSEGVFRVFTGSGTQEPKILEEDESEAPYIESGGRVLTPPVDYLKAFQDDIYIALRDIAGISTYAQRLFFGNRSKVAAAFTLNNNWFKKEVIKVSALSMGDRVIDFLDMNSFRLRPNATTSRYMHIDLGLVHDLAGISCVHCPGVISQTRVDLLTGEETVSKEQWYLQDFVVGLSRFAGEKTPIWKIRDFILDLKKGGLHIARVSADGYQSAQLLQELEVQGIPTQEISCDRRNDPYEIFQDAVYTSRIYLQKHELLHNELDNLVLTAKDKIDHQYEGDHTSKDIADATAGSIYSCFLDKDKALTTNVLLDKKFINPSEDEQVSGWVPVSTSHLFPLQF